MTAANKPLLFLDSLEDPFQALDNVGRGLAAAVLTFWKAGTTTPAIVYADADLTTPLNDVETGELVADSDGFFPLIYLSPDTEYRTRLQTAELVLRFDVDPYGYDQTTDDRNLFRSPLVRAFVDGVIVPAAMLTFTDPDDTDEPKDVFADPDREVRLPNPLTADAAGIFPPIYLDGSYLVTPSWADPGEYPPTVPARILVAFTVVGAHTWTVPDGVTDIDILAVGGGAQGQTGAGAFWGGGGGGGGGIDEQLGVPVTPGEDLDVDAGSGGTILGVDPEDSHVSRGINDLARGGPGTPTGTSNGAGGASGAPQTTAGGTNEGGGGGAGGAGNNGPLGSGGPGLDVHLRWGIVYGQLGIFGGGGGAGRFFSPGHGDNGVGHGTNCGGGGYSDFAGPQPGDDGIVLISYVPPS